MWAYPSSLRTIHTRLGVVWRAARTTRRSPARGTTITLHNEGSNDTLHTCSLSITITRYTPKVYCTCTCALALLVEECAVHTVDTKSKGTNRQENSKGMAAQLQHETPHTKILTLYALGKAVALPTVFCMLACPQLQIHWVHGF